MQITSGCFRHEAFFYADLDDFAEGTSAFVEAGLMAGDPVMVALSSEKLELLRRRLGDDSSRVNFIDMAELGRNPGRIIPAWRRFLDEHSGSASLRGVGEPVGAARSPNELTEWQRHEALLNVAFSAHRPWWLVCTYDTTDLSEDVLVEARRNHPYLAERGRSRSSPIFDATPAVFEGPLPEPPAVAGELSFDNSSLRCLRAAVSLWVASVLPANRAADLVLVAHEMATNSICHGGGSGRLRYWRDGAGAVVEIRDSGRLDRPLVGREFPSVDDEAGRGLWLANQLCDLVQLRSSPEGTVVRLHLA